jgi:hypothetical protein
MADDDHNDIKAEPPKPDVPAHAPAKRVWTRLRQLPKKIIVALIVVSVTATAGLTGVLWFGFSDQGFDFRQLNIGVSADTPDPKQGPVVQVSGDQQTFYWKSNDGDLYRGTIDAGPFRRFATNKAQQIAELQSGSLAKSEEQIRAELRPVLTSIEQRVTDYGDWMYNWWTAWILLTQALGWTWQGLIDGNILRLPDVVQNSLIVEIRSKYNEIVLRPDVLEPQMQAILDRTIAGVQRDLLQICSRYDDDLRTFVRAEAADVEKFEPSGTRWEPVSDDTARAIAVASACRTTDLDSGSSLVDALMAEKPMGDLDDGVNDVILRLSRPFATKLISFIALPVVATAVAGGLALPFIGLAGGAFAGLLAGGAVSAMVIGFSSSAAVDWLLTRADEAISRDDFEGNLRRAVHVSATRFEERVVGALKTHVTEEYSEITSRFLGHRP